MAEESWGPGSTEDAGTSETAGAGGADGVLSVGGHSGIGETAGAGAGAGAGGADGTPEGGRDGRAQDGGRADGADGAPEGGRAPESGASGGGPVAPSPHLSEAELARSGELLNKIQVLYGERVVGQVDLRQSLLAALMTRGHVLIESVPGLAKTTAAQTLASAVSGSFRRIQCTPDLMPSDIVGTQIYNQQEGTFITQLGPVHANFVLLDEINRSSAKTQSAMLEAMQEGQTTIGGENHRLPQPFMVMATQNPIEEEGTYVLPEAQMDRFLMKVVISYPSASEEAEVLEMIDAGAFNRPSVATPISLAELEELQTYTSRVYVHPAIKAYIVDVINTTRGGGPNPLPGLDKHLRMGASPRGGIALMKVAQAHALMSGRNYVVPDDVKAMRHSVLRHRLVRTWDAVADGVSVTGLIDASFNVVPVP